MWLIIIHVVVDYQPVKYYICTMIKRKISNKLLSACKDSPVILIHGARQTGKSTLVKQHAAKDHPARYLTFDDPAVLSAAASNPMGFIENFHENLIIDEVQRVPDIFLAIKRLVDEKRKPGRFILTGSSNIFLLPKVSESLAGRIEVLNLFPLAQSEIAGSERNFIDLLFDKNFVMPSLRKKLTNLPTRIVRGGYPEILSRKDGERMNAWFNSYVTTIIQRDLRDLSNIEKLSDTDKLMRVLASRAGTLLNFSELSRVLTIPQTTLKRYIALLEMIFMIKLVPAWSGNLSKRLIRTPKLYLVDTGLLANLISFDDDRIVNDSLEWGRIIENFVLMEIIKESSWSKFSYSTYHFRSASGQEIDFVIERSDGALVALEVKASQKIDERTFSAIKMFADETKKHFLRGIVLYTGKDSIPFAKNLFALPINCIWD